MADLSPIAGTWVIDPSHTTLGFSARHAMVAKVHGKFTEFEGSFVIDGTDIAKSKAELTMQVASIDSGNAERDGHLKSADFFDADNNKTITFVSTSVAQKSDDTFIVTGDLTISGTTKSVPVSWELIGTSQDPWGGTRIGFEGHAEISRKEFGLTWNVALETGGVLVGDTIKLNLDVEAIKQ